ncbi:hypothetical protein OJAV_G00126740 [Oryzias javanicus]|uniref:Ubiquitin-like protease family profile domain-containing protein n=1 Tax=Oryzias javanicus TaxID=123683 RepID=A0A3S2P504_ORYJA|nr:hypothetical protein OJAV_G00126740 [Oryzias javanicus]
MSAEKRIALMKCHDNPGGNHNGVRGTRDRVVAGRLAALIDPGLWTEKTGSNLEFFPRQLTGNSCGIFMLMYALYVSTSTPLIFSEAWTTIRPLDRRGLLSPSGNSSARVQSPKGEEVPFSNSSQKG